MICKTLLIAILISGCAHANERFYNEDKEATAEKGFLQVLKWKIKFSAKDWPNHVADNKTPEFKKPTQSNEVTATFINHATVVLQFQNQTVITDPVFSKRASPFSFAGPKRHRDPGALI